MVDSPLKFQALRNSFRIRVVTGEYFRFLAHKVLRAHKETPVIDAKSATGEWWDSGISADQAIARNGSGTSTDVTFAEGRAPEQAVSAKELWNKPPRHSRRCYWNTLDIRIQEWGLTCEASSSLLERARRCSKASIEASDDRLFESFYGVKFSERR